uniref:Uncharacterized protein n=1 Tax=Anguilla anguilla TaxID=7936 RepID=A0A0E9RA26_ANGAN
MVSLIENNNYMENQSKICENWMSAD